MAGIVVLIVAAIVVSAILQGDVPDVLEAGTVWVRHILHRYTYLASYGLLYIEESGIPLPAPGDVFVMYVGAHVPRNFVSWFVAWLGLIGVVVAELFGSRAGLGRLISQSADAFNMPELFAGVVVLAVTGTGISRIVSFGDPALAPLFGFPETLPANQPS